MKLPESLTVWRLVAVRHAERAFDLPPGFEVDEIRAGALPPDWRSYPAPEALKDLGTTWAHSRRTPVLQIPSVVVPVEPNYLLNPDHPEMSRITVRQPLPFSFDRRMWKSG